MGNKKHTPRKKTDTNIIRCILLNINEHIETTDRDYGIEESRFNNLVLALEKNGIIQRHSFEQLTTNAYVISDVEKYHEWSKTDFYRAINKYVIPLISAI